MITTTETGKASGITQANSITETGKASSITQRDYGITQRERCITQRERCLDEAKRIVCSDRNEQYGEPEDNFNVIADYWAAYLNNKYKVGVPLDSGDVAHMMVLFKMGRITTAKAHKDDNYIDMAGYAACAMECAANKAKIAREINREIIGKNVDISPENV